MTDKTSSMKSNPLGKLHLVLTSFAALLTVLLFQNCGSPLNSGMMSQSSSSQGSPIGGSSTQPPEEIFDKTNSQFEIAPVYIDTYISQMVNIDGAEDDQIDFKTKVYIRDTSQNQTVPNERVQYDISWYKDDQLLPNETAANLIIRKVSMQDGGRYKLKIKARFEVFGETKELFYEKRIIDLKIFPRTKPTELMCTTSDLYSFEGDTSSIKCYSPVINGGVKYKWYKGGNFIAETIEPEFKIDAVELSDAGQYSVTAYNTLGEISTAASKLIVLPQIKPIINGNQTSNNSLASCSYALYDTQDQGDKSNFFIQLRGPTSYLKRNYSGGDVSGGGVNYRWLQNGVPIVDTKSMSGPIYDLSYWTIKNPAALSVGLYTLEAYNRVGSTVLGTCEVKIWSLSPVQFTKKDQIQKIYSYSPNEYFQLDYNLRSVTGSVPQYRWFKNGAQIDKGPWWYTKAPSDLAGRYKLEVYNSISSDSVEFELQVSQAQAAPPAPKLPTEDVQITAGKYFSLEMRFASSEVSLGQLTYIWKKNGNLLSTENKNTFSKLAALEDSGTYSVEAKNSLGTVNKTFNLQVLPLSAPNLGDVETLAEDCKKFQCTYDLKTKINIESYPTRYRGFKNGILMSGNTFYGNLYLPTSRDRNESATYTLEAFNSAGSDTISIVRTELPPDPVDYVNDQTSFVVRVKQGSRYYFDYFSYSIPQELSYFKDGTMQRFTSHNIYKDGQLLLKNVSVNYYNFPALNITNADTTQSGIYTFETTSPVGKIVYKMKIQVDP